MLIDNKFIPKIEVVLLLLYTNKDTNWCEILVFSEKSIM